MMSDKKQYKIVYCTPALYLAGGVERVLTLKANYFADHFGYDITIILTEGKDKPLFYPLSDKLVCRNMRITTLMDVYNCISGRGGEEIVLDDEVRLGAKRCIDKMIELG
jgi:hypothetical protein